MNEIPLGGMFATGLGVNDTAGSGNDGANAVYDVRKAGDAFSAAPVLSGSIGLLTHADFPDGGYALEFNVVGPTFAIGNTYSVYVTSLVDSQNPTGFAGSFRVVPAVFQFNADWLSVFEFPLFDSAGALLPGVLVGNISAQVSLDGGAFVNMADILNIAVVGNGQYSITPKAADMNGVMGVLHFSASLPAGVQTTIIQFFTNR